MSGANLSQSVQLQIKKTQNGVTSRWKGEEMRFQALIPVERSYEQQEGSRDLLPALPCR